MESIEQSNQSMQSHYSGMLFRITF